METKKTIKKPIISRDKALECGVHFGHPTRRWNPKMKPFIYENTRIGERNISIINVNKTLISLEFSYKQILKIAEKNGTFLFVGTRKFSKETVKLNAQRIGAFYIDNRWLGGTLTNFRTIQNSVKRLRVLERLAKDNFAGYTKKEGLEMRKELNKLERNIGGIKFMRKLPSALIVASIRDDIIAIKEANKLGIPVFSIADTNTDPTKVLFPIPANDDSSKSISLIITTLADAIAQVKGIEKQAAYKKDTDIKLLGVVEIAKEDPLDVLSKSKRSNVARHKSIKEEKKEEVVTTQKRQDHNKKVEKQKDKEKEDYSKLSVTEIKKLLTKNKIEFKTSMKKDELLKLLK